MSEHNYKGIHDLHEDVYHCAQGVSKSMLDNIAFPHTPAHFRAYMDEPRPEPTDAMILGTAVHTAILLPDRKDVFAVRPEGMDLRTKAGKEWKEAQGSRIIVTTEQNGMITRMVDSVWKHPVAKRMLAGAQFEASLFAEDEHGTLRKGRLDALPKAGNFIPDLKTCDTADPDGFERQLANYRYHVQAAYYSDLCGLLGIDKPKFVFICVEKRPPYLTAVYELAEDVMEFGRKAYERDLTLYRHCEATGEWPGYPTECTRIGCPDWMRKEMEKIV